MPEKLLKGEVAYSQKDFVDIFRKYSECSKADYHIYESKKQSLKINCFVVFGLNRSRIKYPSSDLDIFKPSSNLFFGAGFEVSLPEVSKRVFLTMEAIYNRNQFHGHRNGFNSTGTVRNDYTIDITAVKLPIGVRLNFSEKNFTPYLRAGMTPIVPVRYNWLIKEGGGTEAEYDIEKWNQASVDIWAAFGFQRSMNVKHALFAEIRIEKFQKYIVFYGPQGTHNTPSSVLNKMLVFGYKF
jgi:hypothetical protein